MEWDGSEAAGDAGVTKALAVPATDILAEEPDADVVGGDTSTTFSMTTGVGMFGGAVLAYVNTPGDQDWYQITLTAGRSYVIATQAGGMLPHVRLLDANGNELISHIYNSNGTRTVELFDGAPVPADLLRFDVAVSGTYYVAMQDNDGAAGGIYILAAMELPEDTVPAGLSTKFSVSVGAGVFGTPVSGFIEAPGDQDWYRVTLTEAGHFYQFRTVSNTELPVKPHVRLLDANGNEVASGFQTLNFFAETAGTYFLAVQDSDAAFAGGGYQLSARLAHFSIAQIADQLINGWPAGFGGSQRWDRSDLTFSLTGASEHFTHFVRLAFATWQDVCGLTFTETTGVADIAVIQPGGMNVNVVVNGIIQSSEVYATDFAEGLGSHGFGMGLVHEIGHALGLFHAGAYNATARYGIDNHYVNDTFQYSAMSYFGQNNFGGASFAYVSSPQMADIYAVIQLYGEGTARSTDTVYGFNASGHGATGEIYDFSNYGAVIGPPGFEHTALPVFTIYDTGGTDTLDCSGYSADQNISLVSGSWSDIGGWKGNIAIYLTSTIENAVGGSGSDTITGNAANNRLTGNAGNDTLIGDAGNDVLFGGAGDDVIDGGKGDDKANGGDGNDVFLVADPRRDGEDEYDGGNGIDTLDFSAYSRSIQLDLKDGVTRFEDDRIVNIENIIGGSGGDELSGNSKANEITGNSGRDRLDGEGGNDRLFGRGGNDGLDGDEGDDLLDGGDGDDELDGDEGNDQLFGGQGNDELAGGSGNDWLKGGDGDDKLYAGSGNDQLFGGQGNDELYGSSGNDLLSGGSGHDRLTGGGGVDRFLFDSVSGVDFITDFKAVGSGQDFIMLDDALFSGFGGTSAFALFAGGYLRARTTWGDRTELQIDGNGGGNSFQTFAILEDRFSAATLADHMQIV
jgi:serralysin